MAAGRPGFTGHGKLSSSTVTTVITKACFISPFTSLYHGSLPNSVRSFSALNTALFSLIHRASANESSHGSEMPWEALVSSWAYRRGFPALFSCIKTPRLPKPTGQRIQTRPTSQLCPNNPLKSPKCHWGNLRQRWTISRAPLGPMAKWPVYLQNGHEEDNEFILLTFHTSLQMLWTLYFSY